MSEVVYLTIPPKVEDYRVIITPPHHRQAVQLKPHRSQKKLRKLARRAKR